MYALIKNLAPLTLYIAGIVILFMSLSGRVKYGLLFLIPLLPLQNIVEKLFHLPMGNNFNDILLLGMFVGWFVSKSTRKEPAFSPSAYNVILILYFFFTYFSLCMGSNYLGSPFPTNPLDPRLQNWKNYMLLPLIFLIVFNNLKDVKEMKRLFFMMCASMFLMNFYNIRQVNDMTSWVSRAKVHGTFAWLGANEVAAFYATYTFVLIGVFFFMKDFRTKVFLGVLIFINMFINLFMFSRGAYLATLAAFFLIAFVRQRMLLIPLILFLVLWQTVLPQKVIDRLQFSEQVGELDASAQTRLVLWQQSMYYFQQNPIFGVGFNVFSHIGLQRDTHNVFFRTLAEQGFVGLIFFLFILGLAFRRSWRLYTRADDPFLKGLGLGFSACVIAVAIGNFFGDRWTPLPLAAYFWVFLGMVERGNIICSNANAEQSKQSKKASQALRHGRSK